MKKIILASTTILFAVNFAPTAFAETVKDKCAISHGGNWDNAPDSCHMKQPYKRHLQSIVTLESLDSPHSPAPSSGRSRQ